MSMCMNSVCLSCTSICIVQNVDRNQNQINFVIYQLKLKWHWQNQQWIPKYNKTLPIKTNKIEIYNEIYEIKRKANKENEWISTHQRRTTKIDCIL